MQKREERKKKNYKILKTAIAYPACWTGSNYLESRRFSIPTGGGQAILFLPSARDHFIKSPTFGRQARSGTER